MFLSACLLAALPGAGFPQPDPVVVPTADGKRLFVVMRPTIGGERWLAVWDLTKPELSAVVGGIPADTHTLRPTADGKRFTLVGGTLWTVSRIEVRDTATGKRLHNFDVSTKGTGTAAVSPDGNWAGFRPHGNDLAPRVWNTDTGERAEAVEKAVGKVEGTFAFSADSKRLIALTDATYAEYDLATGEATRTWKRPSAGRGFVESAFGQWIAALPDDKGVVTVGATGKRRQSYVIRLHTETKTWPLGELRDHATAPVVSPDGRLLIATGGARPEGPNTYVLKLGADGTPELEDRPEKAREPFGGGDGTKVPAWREWSLAPPTRAGRTLPIGEMPGGLAFAPDGKRLFVAGMNGRAYVHDPDRRVLKATLFAVQPEKAGVVPGWHILTAAGEFVGSPKEAAALADNGKVQDAAKVKEALGVK
ncbi:MAG: hypothetical protein J0I06_20755 [Planctomycetes bacterium]|nr:hypothetical protein [Planctomycetota bacterium]